MRVKTLQIYWHDKQPVFSIDFDSIVTNRFASCGGDTFIRIWSAGEGGEIKYLSTLARHSSGVNCVRWSPVASHLASAGDDGTVLIWEQSATASNTAGLGQQQEDDEDCLEHWKLSSTLRGSNQEVYDIAWSPDGSILAAGGMDGCVRVFDIKDNKVLYVLADHHHFVQGIAIDPLFEYIASQSNDRAVHVYKCDKVDKKSHPKLIAKHSKITNEKTTKSSRLYHDEEVNSFFRRLSFCPDGSLLVTPTGISVSSPPEPTNPNPNPESGEAVPEAVPTVTNTVYIYSRGRIKSAPFSHLPGHKKPAIAVRFSPIKYELIDDGSLDDVEEPEIVPEDLPEPPRTESMAETPVPESTEQAVAETPSKEEHDIVMEKAEALFEPVVVDNTAANAEVTMDVDVAAPTSSDPLINKPRRSIARKNYEESSTEEDAEAVPSLQPPALAFEANKASVQDNSKTPLPPLTYRYVYAVATLDSVTIYSTQKSHTRPIAYLTNLHYAPLTDIAWNKEGTILLMSSTDGYCTLVEFEGEELGKPVLSSESIVKEVSLAPAAVITASTNNAVLAAASPTAKAIVVSHKPAAAAPIIPTTLPAGLIKKRIAPTFLEKRE